MEIETLTISANDYFKNKSKNPEDYELITLIVETSEGYSSRGGVKNALISQAKNANCEAVVNMHYDYITESSGTIFASCSRTKYMAYGVGLKLKEDIKTKALTDILKSD